LIGARLTAAFLAVAFLVAAALFLGMAAELDGDFFAADLADAAFFAANFFVATFAPGFVAAADLLSVLIAFDTDDESTFTGVASSFSIK
jgi:hypothetical protein